MLQSTHHGSCFLHHHTRKPFPAEPLWTGFQLSRGAMVRFLRLRNREGFDVYLRPYAENRNAGYTLLDLDLAAPNAPHRMRANGHEPCVVLQTSPGHLQAWVRVTPKLIEPAERRPSPASPPTKASPTV